MRKDNRSGVTGVHWDDALSVWIAQISSKEKRVCLGRFKNFDDAAAARKAAERELGYRSNHGRVA